MRSVNKIWNFGSHKFLSCFSAHGTNLGLPSGTEAAGPRLGQIEPQIEEIERERRRSPSCPSLRGSWKIAMIYPFTKYAIALHIPVIITITILTCAQEQRMGKCHFWGWGHTEQRLSFRRWRKNIWNRNSSIFLSFNIQSDLSINNFWQCPYYSTPKGS